MFPSVQRIVRPGLGLALAWAGMAPVLAAPPPSFIRTQGRGFVDQQGHPFLVKSIGLGNWMVPEGYMFHFDKALAPHEIDSVIRTLIGPADADRFWNQFRDGFISQADIDFIARAGFTTVRVPMNWKLFAADADPPVLEGPGYALIDRLIGWCREAGLRVILDMHASPGGQTGVNHDDGVGFALLFYVPRYRRITLALWHKIAARYADDPTVLGYDLVNEPISPYMDEDLLNPRLEEYYRAIAGAVRAEDRNHVLFLQGGQWASNFRVFSAPFDNNMAYSYHMFWADPVRSSIASMLDFSIRFNVPLWLGESGELTDAWNTQFRTLQEKYGIAWSFWTFKNFESTSTVLSISHIPEWDVLTALGDETPDVWPPVTPQMRAKAKIATDAYLRGMRYDQTSVNGCYLVSLGLTDPLSTGPGCSTHPVTPAPKTP